MVKVKVINLTAYLTSFDKLRQAAVELLINKAYIY